MQPGIDAHLGEELVGALGALLLGGAAELHDGTAHDATNRVTTVKGRVGVLEHDLHGADVLRGARVEGSTERLAIELDDAAAVGMGQAEQHLRQCGLARPRLTDESEGLSSGNGKSDVAKHANRFVVLPERLGKTGELNERIVE